MRIACIGGGPAGLYFAILMKKADPAHDITIYERNRPDDTFGWGVVFSDATLGNFGEADPESYAEITRSFHHWDDCDVFFKGAQDHLRRARLLRHRPPAPAQHPAGARRRARREAGLRGRDRRRRRPAPGRSRPDRRRRRREQPGAQEVRRTLPAGHRRAQVPLHLARHPSQAQCLHLHHRALRMGLVPGARLPVRPRHQHLHRRVPRGNLAGRRPRQARPGRLDRLLREALRRSTCRATR